MHEVIVSRLKDTLLLLVILSAYGITGHIDLEDEILLELSYSSVAAQTCPAMPNHDTVAAPTSARTEETTDVLSFEVEPTSLLNSEVHTWMPECPADEPSD